MTDELITRQQIVRRATTDAGERFLHRLDEWLGVSFYLGVAPVNAFLAQLSTWLTHSFYLALNAVDLVWVPAAHAVWVCTKDRGELDERSRSTSTTELTHSVYETLRPEQ